MLCGFRTEGTEKKRHLANHLSNYKRAILSDALISLEVNLTKETDSTNFSDLTDRKMLIDSFNNGHKEITFDYEAKPINISNLLNVLSEIMN